METIRHTPWLIVFGIIPVIADHPPHFRLSHPVRPATFVA